MIEKREAMKKGVIYARYSSDRQNEQSIAGQVDVCTEWAKDNDISIIHIYHDEALTGKTDKRPDFQRMIDLARQGEIGCIVVKDLSRFGRDYIESGKYLQKIF